MNYRKKMNTKNNRFNNKNYIPQYSKVEIKTEQISLKQIMIGQIGT